MSAQTALVTGGATGIGLQTARALLDRGARVVVADVAEPPADLDARHVRCDVRSAADWDALVADAGPFHIAFLNAGVASREVDITKVGLEDIDTVLRVDIDGVILGTRAVVPGMAAAGGGSIVATASLAGLIAFAPDPVYTAAKHAVVGWVRAIAAQLTALGVRINAVCPGVVDTAIITPVQRVGLERAQWPLMQPEQITAAVLDLFDGDGTGEAWVCQPGREALRFDFRRVPGPGGEEAHRRPPSEMSET